MPAQQQQPAGIHRCQALPSAPGTGTFTCPLQSPWHLLPLPWDNSPHALKFNVKIRMRQKGQWWGLTTDEARVYIFGSGVRWRWWRMDHSEEQMELVVEVTV